MATPPLRKEISDTYPLPSDATARTGFGKLWDYVIGLLGATGDAAEARAALGILMPKTNDFRLTLTSGAPVTTSDVTGATTIFAAPIKGNAISLYDGSAWNIRDSAQFSLALGTLVSGRPYDVFCYDNAGVPTLEALAWTNDTTRATALVSQDGVLCKTGALTRRYMGTFYTTSTTTTEDSEAKRYLWNYYNRVERTMSAVDTTNSWTYTTPTWRQANGSAANQLECVIGVVEDVIIGNVHGISVNSGNANVAVGVGVNSTSVNSAKTFGGGSFGSVVLGVDASFSVYPIAGRNYLAWLEISAASGTTTWYGDNGVSLVQTGIIGTVKS